MPWRGLQPGACANLPGRGSDLKREVVLPESVAAAGMPPWSCRPCTAAAESVSERLAHGATSIAGKANSQRVGLSKPSLRRKHGSSAFAARWARHSACATSLYFRVIRKLAHPDAYRQLPLKADLRRCPVHVFTLRRQSAHTLQLLNIAPRTSFGVVHLRRPGELYTFVPKSANVRLKSAKLGQGTFHSSSA